MRTTIAVRVAMAAWCAVCLGLARPATGRAADAALAAKLTAGDEANEYWDVTAWLDSGEQVSARFLVTNQGPGDRTAAAVGHLRLATGEVLPFQWGRSRDEWQLAPDGRRLAIGKAALDLTGTDIVLTVASKKRGIDLRLAIDRSAGSVSTHDLDVAYATDLVLPAAARGRIQSREVTGTGAVTHTWMERPEGELLRRRDELLARGGEIALYLSVRTRVDGTQHRALFIRRAGHVSSRSDETPLTLDAATLPGGDERYPVSAEWTVKGTGLDLQATLDRELLRMNPLDILPQPFRFLLSLGGHPQRVWADARVKLDLQAEAAAPALATELRGIATSTFARPVER